MTGPAPASTALTQAEVAGVLALTEAAGRADAVSPLSEHVLLHLRYDGDSDGDSAGGRQTSRDFVRAAAGEVAGYAHLDLAEQETSGELVVHPDHRRQGLGRALISQLTAAANGAANGAKGHSLRLWAHGDLPAAARLAEATGFERFRALWQMRRSLREPLAAPVFPVGRTLRTFVPGQDEEEWLSLNGRAFAKHPEQGAWTRHDLELRECEPWFDSAGFFIAMRDGRMAGFHWTKVAPPQEAAADAPGDALGDAQGQQSLGEVYVVGVDPAEQGSGLGRALTLAGLHHLRDLGLAQAMLYVDEDNVPAIRMYEALGFTRTRTDVMYRQR